MNLVLAESFSFCFSFLVDAAFGMAQKDSKLIGLLEAYEELTRKETVCLREENWNALLETQAKKGKIVGRMQQFDGASLSPQERSDFNERVGALRDQESENSKTLASMLKENRDLYKKVVQGTRSASKALRAYGPPTKGAESAGTLTDRA